MLGQAAADFQKKQSDRARALSVAKGSLKVGQQKIARSTNAAAFDDDNRAISQSADRAAGRAVGRSGRRRRPRPARARGGSPGGRLPRDPG